MTYLAGRIWATLKRNPGDTGPNIAARFGAREGPIYTCLSHMKKEGHVRKDGRSGRHSKWYAIGARPQDRRGCHVNSAANLLRTREETMAALQLAFKAKGIDPESVRPRKLPKKARQYYAGELERCWSLPISCTVAE